MAEKNDRDELLETIAVSVLAVSVWKQVIKSMTRKTNYYVGWAVAVLFELAGFIAGICASIWTAWYLTTLPLPLLLKVAIIPTGTILAFVLCSIVPDLVGYFAKSALKKGDKNGERIANDA